MKQADLAELPAGSGQIECALVPGIGPFNNQLNLYVDDAGLREITFTVRGDGKKAKK